MGSAKLAVEAGVPEAAVEATRTRRELSFDDPDQALVYRFVDEFYRWRRVGDATFEAAKARFGARGVVDLVGIMGYYALMAMALNIFEAPLSAGATLRLDL